MTCHSLHRELSPLGSKGMGHGNEGKPSALLNLQTEAHPEEHRQLSGGRIEIPRGIRESFAEKRVRYSYFSMCREKRE